MDREHSPFDFLETVIAKRLLVLNIAIALLYFYVITFWFPRSNTYLYALLIASQVFYLWQLLTFIFTVWDTDHQSPRDPSYTPGVDVFITVAGEPKEIIRETVMAAKAMDYPAFDIYILNDGYVAGKANWRDMEDLARELNVNCITRREPGGAKAGNINNALKITNNPFVVIFDADYVPEANFLSAMVPYAADPFVGFVQSPQFYKNSEENYVTGGSWEQQELFYGPICKGKNRLNSATMCGTNMLIRRSAILEAGGMCDTNIAEDFVTGMFIHENGWRSVYVPEVLAQGLAPEDFLSYYKQQYRWARGSLEVIFKYNPLLRSGLTWAQKVQYLASASFYLSGLFVLINAAIPLIFFFTGAVPFTISTMTLALLFLPYIFITIYNLQLVSNFSYTYRALAFSMASFPIHLQAIWATLSGKAANFSVTSKKKLEGQFLRLATPHLIYIGLVIVGAGVALAREGLTASLLTNLAWAIFYIAIFLPFIKASLPEASVEHRQAVTALQRV
jgi:cellulose synthase (UDP-forming)